MLLAQSSHCGAYTITLLQSQNNIQRVTYKANHCYKHHQNFLYTQAFLLLQIKGNCCY